MHLMFTFYCVLLSLLLRIHLLRILSRLNSIGPCLCRCCRESSCRSLCLGPYLGCVKWDPRLCGYLGWDLIWCLNRYLGMCHLRCWLKGCLRWSLGPRVIIWWPCWSFLHSWKAIPVVPRIVIHILSLQS